MKEVNALACPHCDKSFKARQGLQTHIFKAHPEHFVALKGRDTSEEKPKHKYTRRKKAFGDVFGSKRAAKAAARMLTRKAIGETQKVQINYCPKCGAGLRHLDPTPGAVKFCYSCGTDLRPFQAAASL
jgi:uncharacterized C2H2 Zn-finger protein